MDYMQQTAFTKLSPRKCMNDILKMSKLLFTVGNAIF